MAQSIAGLDRWLQFTGSEVPIWWLQLAKAVLGYPMQVSGRASRCLKKRETT